MISAVSNGVKFSKIHHCIAGVNPTFRAWFDDERNSCGILVF